MSDKKNTPKRSEANQGIQANSVKAEVMAVGRGARAVQNRYAGADDSRQQLEALIEQLQKALQDVPADKKEDAEVVSELTKELVDKAGEEQPNRKILEIKGENLKKAAENLAQVAPIVVSIATQIVTAVLTGR